ncbi:Mediator of RNA polymerase II transcription subunit 14 [Borealophlyctis nickersoniae]|nr:Mediator of RNA polymerase II transcription subunit 14 [Borealophlyctis nickersoniae]
MLPGTGDHGSSSAEGNSPAVAPISGNEQRADPVQSVKTAPEDEKREDSFPQLPRVPDNAAPLRDLVTHFTQRAYGDIKSLAQELPQHSDVRKKKKLVESLHETLKQTQKLLAVVRWAKDADKMERALGIHHALDAQDAHYRAAAHEMALLDADAKRLKQNSLDIPTAISVLTTGRLPLPTIIRKKGVTEPEPLPQAEVEKTLKTLEDVIRLRLLCDDVVPVPFRKHMTIAKGCVTFRVEDEFQITLTLPGKRKEDCWQIVDLKILVRCASGYEGMPPCLDESRVAAIKRGAQCILAPEEKDKGKAPATAPTQESAAATPSANRPYNPLRLVELYDYLHKFCLNFQLQLLKLQADYLSRTRWRDRLLVEYNRDEQVLRLHYWAYHDSVPAHHPPGVRPPPPKFKNALEFAFKSTPAAFERERANIASSLKKQKQSMPEASPNPTVVASLTFGNEGKMRRWLQVRCLTRKSVDGDFEEAALIDPETGEKAEFKLHPSNLNIESVLLRHAEFQASIVIHRIRNILLGHTNPLPPAQGAPAVPNDRKRKHSDAFAPVPPLSAFSETDVQLDTAPPALDTSSMEIKTCPSLTVAYWEGKTLRVGVDVRSGKVLVREIGAGADSADKKMALVEDKVNKDHALVLKGVLWLRYQSILDRLESMATEIGLQPLRQVPLSQAELSKLCTPLPEHIIYLRFRGFVDSYIVIAVGAASDWHNLGLDSMGNETVHRVWLITTRPKKAANYVIETVTPLTEHILTGSQFPPLSLVDPSRDKGKQREGEPLKRQRMNGAVDDTSTFAWRVIDENVLVHLDAVCRKQIAYTGLAADLTRHATPYFYILRGKYSLLSPNNLPVPENRIAAFAPRVCIPARALSLHNEDRMEFDGDDEDEAIRRGLPPFGDIFLTIEKCEKPVETGSGDLYAIVGIGRKGIKSARVIGKCMIRKNELPVDIAWKRTGGSVRNLNVPTSDATHHYAYDSALGAVTFELDNVDTAISDLMSEWRAAAMVLCLARQFKVSETLLARNGVRAYSCDLASFHVQFDTKAMMKIWWELDKGEKDGKGSSSSGNESDFSGKFRVELSVGDEGEEKDSATEAWQTALKPLEVFAEIHLNEERDILKLLQIMSQMSPLLRLLSAIEQRRNIPSNYLSPGKRLVAIIPRSLSHIRLLYGPSHAIDFVLAKPSVFALFDGSRSAFEPCPHYNFIPNPSPADNPAPAGWRSAMQHLNIAAIPLFSTTFQKQASPVKRLGLVEGICELVDDPLAPDGSVAMPMPHGVVFNAGMLEVVLAKIERHMETVATLGWFAQEIKALAGQGVAMKANFPHLQIEWESATMKCTMIGTGDGPFLVRPEPKGLDAQTIASFGAVLNKKLSGIPPGTDMRPFLRLLLNISMMPINPIRDLCHMANFENNQMKFSLNWCMVMPPGAPAYLPAAGQLGTLIELESGRMSLVVRLSSPELPRSVFIAIRYNYLTGIINPWRPSPDDRDLTRATEGTFLQQYRARLMEEARRLPTSHTNQLGLLYAQASAQSFPIQNHGPGKLAVALKPMATGQAAGLRDLMSMDDAAALAATPQINAEGMWLS